MKVKILLLILMVAATEFAVSQSFKKLSRPEKCWVLFHPFKAKKAASITKEVQRVVDSIRKNGNIGADNLGGKLDAFKHAYWMASLALEIGSKQALKLGKAHEKGNYLEFKHRKLEDSALPDSVSTVMDLRNNEAGAKAVEKQNIVSPIDVQKKIMDALVNGTLMVIRKDEEGNFLTCEGKMIPMKEWTGKWGIPKCLTPSASH